MDERSHRGEAAPAEAENGYAEDGVDVTLVRLFLDLTPAQRLRRLEAWLRSVEWLRRARRAG